MDDNSLPRDMSAAFVQQTSAQSMSIRMQRASACTSFSDKHALAQSAHALAQSLQASMHVSIGDEAMRVLPVEAELVSDSDAASGAVPPCFPNARARSTPLRFAAVPAGLLGSRCLQRRVRLCFRGHRGECRRCHGKQLLSCFAPAGHATIKGWPPFQQHSFRSRGNAGDFIIWISSRA